MFIYLMEVGYGKAAGECGTATQQENTSPASRALRETFISVLCLAVFTLSVYVFDGCEFHEVSAASLIFNPRALAPPRMDLPSIRTEETGLIQPRVRIAESSKTGGHFGRRRNVYPIQTGAGDGG